MTVEQQPEASVAPSHAHRGSPSRLWTWAACAIAGAAGFGLVYANTVVGQVDGAFTPIDNSQLISDAPEPTTSESPDPEDLNDGESLNILLMGSDARDGENGKIGGKVADGMRNDTTIIMHISADRSRVDLVSIPRDAQVEIPKCKYFDGSSIPATSGDFNISFSNGGRHGNAAEAAACTINTVQKMSGLTIDHWAVVDFSGFEDMIDAIGGVPMCIPERIVSKKAKVDLKAGPQVLNGKEALGIARMRTAEVGDVSGSDLQRIARQHQLLRQTARVILSKNLLTDAGELTLFLKSAASAMTMDPDLASTKYLLGLAFSLRNIAPSSINFYTVPWKLTDDYLDVIILKSAGTMWKELKADKPLTKVGNDDAGDAWEEVIDKSPEPVPTDTDATESILSECTA
ncbi:LCP family protein [Demequina sp.]|uniref:LCP family protein n=1 Tax=Demequina sp. TaxID=2050685 RepID=UPI003D0CBB6B